MKQQNYINHVAFVLDCSSSMRGREDELIRVVDGQIAYLARRSEDLGQETRVTVYMFNHQATCVIYDKDVLRLPSIRDFYRTSGMTALIDATIMSQGDLALQPEKYGDHAFLTFVFTDGEENKSTARPDQLAALLKSQPEHWTVGVLVPNLNGKIEAQKFGFPKDNIAIWDVNSSAGIAEVGETIKTATDSFMAARTTGVRGTRTLFSTAPDAVNKATVAAAGLRPLDPSTYMLVPITKPRAPHGVLNRDNHRVWEISEFTKHATGNFTVGSVFYELSKKEKIQGNKTLALLEIDTSQVFYGPTGVRDLIGLPAVDASVAPDFNPKYKIFVQSTSVNRHLVPGTKLLVLK